MNKHLKKIIIAITPLLFLFSCVDLNKKHISVETSIQFDQEKASLAIIMEEVEKKLLKYGFEVNSATNTTTSGEVTFESKIESEDLDFYKTLFTSNELNIWNTFRTSDRFITNLDTAMVNTDNFTPFYEIATNYFPPEVIGICMKSEKLDEIILTLTEKLKPHPRLKLMWGADKMGMNNEYHVLYMIDKKDRADAPITEKDIINTGIQNDNTGQLVVNLEFDQTGSKKFAAITKKAAHNGNRSLAIELNNTLLICPRVISEITGGSCSISGNFTMSEAANLGSKIRAGRYSQKFTVQNITVTEVE